MKPIYSRHFDRIIFFVNILLSPCYLMAQGTSVYSIMPKDEEAVYFTQENYGIRPDGKSDVSDSLQQAINRLKKQKNFGIVFIPEGKYLVSKTIYIPKAIRLIGYGKNRPEFILGPSTPGYQTANPDDKGEANYMFWFTGGIVEPGSQNINDANAGTFYSAFSNINIRIEKGNPAAVALRTHFAQHSFISHCDIQTGEGKAGVFDIGNFMEDVRFYGGDYGIYTTKTSPGWQFVMLDTYFEGQRKAAIRTQEAGLTILRMEAVNVPHVIEVMPGYWEKLFMQDCRFNNIRGEAIHMNNGENSNNQVSLLNIICKNVPVFASFGGEIPAEKGKGEIYQVRKLVYGLQIPDLDSVPEFRKTSDIIAITSLPMAVKSDIPQLPPVAEWVNLKDLGAIGDGETDDTPVLRKAIEDHRVIYLPQGWYRVTGSIKLKPNTILIGLSPIGTQIMLTDNTADFSGFGGPVPLLEVPGGGNAIVTGIGLSTADYNSRAVACKWSSGAESYMNDVKFLGGHGDMNRGPEKPWQRRTGPLTRENRIRQGIDPAWDTQYWSLWINGGGGVFADIWTASTFASNGIYVSNTSVQGKIYAMSVEHHVRNEVRFKAVSGWKVYALQLEEETRESQYCQPLEIEDSHNMLFANLYTFRVIRVNTPGSQAIRTWNCSDLEILNYHNYAQTLFPFTNALFDINSGKQLRPWEFARFYQGMIPEKPQGIELASGFEFAGGICADSKGNVYFCETRMKRIYSWSPLTNSISLLADFPWEPHSLSCDSKDNLLVVFRYYPQPGYMIDGEQEKFENPPDARGTSYSGWGNSGFATWVYSINPGNPEETIQKLGIAGMGTITGIYKALYPGNRWRDSHDFNEVILEKPELCFLAPDNKTIIPICYDLARCNSLAEGFPGKPVYMVNEYDKRVVKMEMDNQGFLSGLKYFAEKGEFCSSVDENGNVYIPDGNIYVFDPTGKQSGYYELPGRPVTLCVSGDFLFVTSADKLYRIRLK